MDLKLDRATGDLWLKDFEGPRLFRVSENVDAIGQRVLIRLRTFLGEWFADQSVGVPWFQQILGGRGRVSTETMSVLLRAEIAATPGIVSVEKVEATYSGNRNVLVSFRARTEVGTIVIENENLAYSEPAPVIPVFDPAALVSSIVTRNASTVITDASGSTSDQYGLSVASSGDTYVVGSPNEDGSIGGINPTRNDSMTDAGAVFVYRRTGNSLTLEATIKAPTPTTSYKFGSWVDIDGDTLIVGEDISAVLCHVYVRSGTTWSLQQSITHANHVSADKACSGAIDGDLIVVGCCYESGSGSGVNPPFNDVASTFGCAYTFHRSGTVWTFEAYLKSITTPAWSDYFGISCDVSGDTVVVGSFGSDAAVSDGGAVFVYTRSGAGVWTASQTLTASVSHRGGSDFFGYRVAIEGDLLAISSIHEDGSGLGLNPTVDDGRTNVGAVYLFERSAGTFSQTAYIKPTVVSSASMGFGYSLDIFGGIVAISAPLEDNSATNVNGNQNLGSLSNSGCVYCWRKVSGTWTQVLYLKAGTPASSEQFGGMASYFSFPQGMGVAVSETGIIVGAHATGNGRALVF